MGDSILDKRVTVRVDKELAEALDCFIADHVIPTTSKQDALRHILRDWLTARGYFGGMRLIDGIQPDPSPTPAKKLFP